MRPDRYLLAFDTSAAHCAAALSFGGTIVEDRLELLQRGQAERLMPLLMEILEARGIGFGDLASIGVGIGPGNFTGIRISVAAARGLGLSLGVPVVGVSMFEVMRGPDAGFQDTSELVSLEAPRGAAYVQHYRLGRPFSPPRQIDPNAPPDDLRQPDDMIVTGYMAREIADALDAEARPAVLTQIAPRIATCAESRLGSDQARPARPSPLYVRPADAAPPKQDAPVILDDA